MKGIARWVLQKKKGKEFFVYGNGLDMRCNEG